MKFKLINALIYAVNQTGHIGFWCLAGIVDGEVPRMEVLVGGAIAATNMGNPNKGLYQLTNFL